MNQIIKKQFSVLWNLLFVGFILVPFQVLAERPDAIAYKQTDLIVFSYDRPLQLCSYLVSLQKHLDNLNQTFVIYRTSTSSFHDAYEMVKKLFPEVQFYKQPDDNPRAVFKEMLLDITFNKSTSKYVMFGVDDLMMTDPLDIQQCEALLDQNPHYKFSLRLGKNIQPCPLDNLEAFLELGMHYEYLANDVIKITYYDMPKCLKNAPDKTKLFKHITCFDWVNLKFADMEIFDKNDLRDEMQEVTYDSPNTFEISLFDYALTKRNSIKGALCFNASKITNLVCNIVQNDSEVPRTIVGECDKDFLLKKFNEGYIFDVEQFCGFRTTITHPAIVPQLALYEPLVYLIRSLPTLAADDQTLGLEKHQDFSEQKEKIKLYALCTPSHAILRDQYFLPSIQDDYEIIIENVDQESQKGEIWTDGFNATVLKKVELIIKAIQENWGQYFILSDVDIQFFNKTEDKIRELMRDDIDMLVQRDHPISELCPCSGFMIIRSNEKTMQLWKAALSLMQQFQWYDQDALTSLFTERYDETLSLKWDYLPPEFFGGGTLTGKRWLRWDFLPVPRDVLMHHANWTIGVENKISQLEYVKYIVKKRTDEKTNWGPQECEFAGHRFTFFDVQESCGTHDVLEEIRKGEYPLEAYQFSPGDVIIDIGAHVGVISIMLAKLNPQATIYAIEACPPTFDCLVKNIALNGVTNVKPFCYAVSGKTEDRVIMYDLIDLGSSTASSLHVHQMARNIKARQWEVPAISLDDFCQQYSIEKCAMLKIDCEGSEYDILLHSKKFETGLVHDMLGEFHMNETLASQGFSMERLYEYCKCAISGNIKIIFQQKVDYLI